MAVGRGNHPTATQVQLQEEINAKRRGALGAGNVLVIKTKWTYDDVCTRKCV